MKPIGLRRPTDHVGIVDGIPFGPFPSTQAAAVWQAEVDARLAEGWWPARLCEVYLQQILEYDKIVLPHWYNSGGVLIDATAHRDTPDNHNIVLTGDDVGPRGVRLGDPLDLVLVKGGWWDDEPDMDRFNLWRQASRVPEQVSLKDLGLVAETHAHPAGGEVLVVHNILEMDTPEWLICWREDRRRTRDIDVVNGHDESWTAHLGMEQALAEYRPQPRITPPRRLPDRQRSAVYAWEDAQEWFRAPALSERLDIDHAQDLVNEVWATLGLDDEPPACRVDRRNAAGTGSANRHDIRFGHEIVERGLVLHEVSHSAEMALDLKDPGHGPAFVAIAMALYDHFGGAWPEMMQGEATRHAITWAPDVLEDIRSRMVHNSAAPEAGGHETQDDVTCNMSP